ncbi:hypothetical protein PsalN5692_00665 [Piscirickettsia salmonis]|nr:hypothetical protein PsalN5692_00665 [Piscirickettsia salmonis]
MSLSRKDLIKNLFITPSSQKSSEKFIAINKVKKDAAATCSGNCASGNCR